MRFRRFFVGSADRFLCRNWIAFRRTRFVHAHLSGESAVLAPNRRPAGKPLRSVDSSDFRSLQTPQLVDLKTAQSPAPANQSDVGEERMFGGFLGELSKESSKRRSKIVSPIRKRKTNHGATQDNWLA
jgi:hypothetical protein